MKGVKKMDKQSIKEGVKRYLKVKHGVTLEEAKDYEIFNAISLTIMEEIVDNWNETSKRYNQGRMAYYLSAEYLMGRALGNNLINLGLYDEVKEVFNELNLDLNKIEEVEEDAGLGNGGLGRLAACFIESAATMEMPLVGYGIRYSNGLFKQNIENGFQTECEDNWLKYGDCWSIRKDDEVQIITFSDMKVKAVPYDVPIIGYDTKNINTLRLWQCEALREFDFNLFNNQQYIEAVSARNKAEDISRVLYPNDTAEAGKVLRLRQQYFFSSASMKDIIKKYKATYGDDFSDFAKYNVAQLNDTHPTISILEFMRILVDEEKVEFNTALDIAKKFFNYTNHTILAEALEKWDIRLIERLFPRILQIAYQINDALINELRQKGYDEGAIWNFRIVTNDQIRMANLAIYVGSAVNGVAALHTEILKNKELNNWYNLYPEKFQNKTNGITPRRWLRLCNPELSEFITELLGTEELSLIHI